MKVGEFDGSKPWDAQITEIRLRGWGKRSGDTWDGKVTMLKDTDKVPAHICYE